MDNNSQVFAVCKVTDDAAVERTLDSGRYFVLRITNEQGRHAFIGIAFNERNDAFDFNVALSEFKNELEREELANKLSHEAPVGPMKDMSLKDGEKIKIKIVWKCLYISKCSAPFLSCFQFPCTQAVKKRNTDDDHDAPGGSSSTTQSSAPKPVPGGGLLAPPKGMLSPPPAKGPFAAPSTAHTTRTPSATSSSSGFDDFGSFTSRYVRPHALLNLCVDHISLPMCTPSQ
jgi:hypothetical protein